MDHRFHNSVLVIIGTLHFLLGWGEHPSFLATHYPSLQKVKKSSEVDSLDSSAPEHGASTWTFHGEMRQNVCT